MPLEKALEAFSAQSLCDLGIFLSIFSFMLHLGRPTADRAFAGAVPKLAGAMTSGLYTVLEDGSLVLAVLAGFFHLNLDLMADIKIGLPFIPLGTVVLAWALLGKLQGRGPARPAHARRRVAAGALLDPLGYVLRVEAPGSEYTTPGPGFPGSPRALRSNQNPELSILCFYVCFSALLALAAVGTYRVFRDAPDGTGGTPDRT